MNFDKESKSEDFFLGGGGGGGGGAGWREGRFQTEQKNMYLLFVFMLYIKCQVPSSGGSLVFYKQKE